MKRYGNLYGKITDFGNLLSASQKAQKGKRFKINVLKFNYNLEAELLQLQTELQDKTYQPGDYQTFFVYESKKRMISAAPYRDRVIHHALCNIILPIFERTFIHDSYANRVGFGTHRALERFTKFARSSKYILQCDIKKYFPSIDHSILKELIRKKIKCPDTLWLIDQIIDGSNKQETVIEYFTGDDLLTPVMRKRGLPIGNLTSQFFANVFLNEFDHFVKEELKIKKYIRYVDDFVLLSDDRENLAESRIKIEEYLSKLRLKIHPIKSQLFATRKGPTFLGFRVLPDRIRVRNDNLRKGRKRLRKLKLQYQQGKMSIWDIQDSLRSWMAHLKHGDTWQLREKICWEFVL
jgi:retron-type reverse transcriptase